ncbi:rhomboid family intramembrane serine protease GlpG [Pseudoalteromonas aurantia]|uniref:Rhomboid family intramembrane serine protease GlpG n=1 Tax=Pseudoalteromonas aurantia TaxID=43654 RepID=A0A5S3V6E5_9GAMM|nr:rhomboid family intramembrane serine protease GlpG [Pseudoalteromonas aurantia]TMO67164.1 rhomboid family intramembrane serine protease GlpG [Pseudoalteromonas aurantia]
MILIGTSDNPRAVQGAADYFKRQGVNAVLKSMDGWHVEVWVPESEEHSAIPLWNEFVDNPHDEKYLTASWHTGNTETQFLYKGGSLNLAKRFNELHYFLKTIFVIALVIFSCLYIVEGKAVYALLQFDPRSPLTWLSPALMHFSALHLIFNLAWWLHLGNKIIKRVGAKQLILIFLISSLVSNWAQYLFVDQRFGGLSGVVYALLGYAWVYSAQHNHQEALIEKPVVGFMLIWMIFGFTDVFFISMANWAHLFGLLTGMLLALLSKLKRA